MADHDRYNDSAYAEGRRNDLAAADGMRSQNHGIADTPRNPNAGVMGHEKAPAGSDPSLPSYNNSRDSWQAAEERKASLGVDGGQAQNIFSSGEKNYRTVGRWMAGIILITNQVGIGILSLPRCTAGIPHCVNIVDMCKVVGGKPLEILGGIAMIINICFTCTSATVTVSIALNTMSEHAISVLIVMISLGIADPQGAPIPFEKEVKVIGDPTFREGLTSCLQVAYAYAGNVGFPSLLAEMKDPSSDFLPGLVILQSFSIPLYIIVAITIYCLAGQYTTSPSLGSAPPVPAKIAYGVMLPCLLATGVVFGHTAIKFMYVTAMRWQKATDQLTSRNVRSWGSWVGCATIFWLLAFILGNSIPVFDSILSISSATLIAWWTFGISAIFWFHLNRGQMFANWRKISLFVLNVLIIVMSLFMNSAGMWAAIMGLLDVFNNEENEIRGPFTCANNALF
ncbi:amino acid transporter [Verticillium alfalfae VaMs.102]|uniref:Amino acid transporter n=1 Tax=Verticillium alfalfae (strain VaMs.102 / ATCC MYA-4576 / FGSC 10136) TaxID=526221 RepID=C9S9H6_VERA1|nr:amino acid transporter [Verticillium alfalfae VaMs.102]EEY16039.1 amino acid transporter [Verticillium alfalfae VaMs.102]